MTTGILIIAVGAKGYGQLAGSLAASLRANNVTLPICLAHQPETITRLNEEYLDLFTDFVLIDDKHITLNDNTECYIKAKAHMDELTPYDYTLFMDADMLALNNGSINNVIDSLNGVDFAIKNSGFTTFDSDTLNADSKQWANIFEVRDKFGFTNEKIWNVHSEFVFWKKGHPVFAKWVENFNNIRVENIEFGGCIPDELPLWIAMCQLGVEPHIANWHPSYWPMDSRKMKRLKDMKEEGYCAISIGGNNIHQVQREAYDLLISLYAKMLNLRYPFKAQPKKKWVANRTHY
jgi:hypothetical protein